MRLELIRQNKLKITLGREDLSRYGLDADSISRNSDEVQAMFFSVLRKAEEEVGFAYGNSRLVVEAMPLSGGMVIFVTKVDTAAEQQLFEKISSRQGVNVRCKPAERTAEKSPERSERSTCMAELDSFEAVVNMCYSVPTYYGGSLYGDGGKYYIVVATALMSTVAEYGRVLDEHAQTIVEEHAEPIIYRRAFDIIRNRFKQ